MLKIPKDCCSEPVVSSSVRKKRNYCVFSEDDEDFIVTPKRQVSGGFKSGSTNSSCRLKGKFKKSLSCSKLIFSSSSKKLSSSGNSKVDQAAMLNTETDVIEIDSSSDNDH